MLNALLWNLALTAALAVVLIALGRLPSLGKRPALRHWLWLLLLVKLVTPPLVARLRSSTSDAAPPEAPQQPASEPEREGA